MKQISKTYLVLVGLFGVLGVVMYSCGGGGSMTSVGYGGGTSMPAPSSSASTVQLVVCPAGGESVVSIVSRTAGFSPASITVPLNTTVKWSNSDTITHTVTSTSVPVGGTFDSTAIPGASVCMKFTAAGTFNYHCSIHPTTMIGVVSVQ